MKVFLSTLIISVIYLTNKIDLHFKEFCDNKFSLLQFKIYPSLKNFTQTLFVIFVTFFQSDCWIILLALVFETFLKLGKLQCKSSFNINEVLLLMIKDFETIQIVKYFPEGCMMDFETTCYVSRVTCHVSLVTFQPFPNRKSQGPEIFT